MAYKYGYRSYSIISNVWKRRTYMRNVDWYFVITWTLLLAGLGWFWTLIFTRFFI